VNVRYSYRSAQPYSLTAAGEPASSERDQARIGPDGKVTQRNTARKDNVFSALDLRLSREFRLSGRVGLEPIVEDRCRGGRITSRGADRGRHGDDR
jgi:hypothetical protein